MRVAATIHEFLDTARKSKQIDNARLDALLGGQTNVPADPRKLAALLVRMGLLTGFQAEQFLLGKHKGFTLGGYRILDRIGSGGTGTVYLAEHELMRRRAAIKVLPPVLAEDPGVVERFQIEAQAAAALDHPNVVHLYDFRHDGRMYYLVMEYVDGPNLQQVIARKGGLDVAVACEYARQAAHGLHHAHQAGLVHRDVKPANILVDTSGTIKVLDLGLARFDRENVEGVTRKFHSHAILGTADYLAPEQALNLHDVDARADVYGLGATLYALLTGQPPFHGGTIGQKLMWHQTKVPDRVDEVRPEIPAALADVVAWMLQKRPEDRPQDMPEVIEALSPWADEATPPSLPSPRSLVEMRCVSSRAGEQPATGTGRLMADGADTLRAQGDTAKLLDAPPKRRVRAVKRVRKRTGPGLLVLGGLVTLGLAVAAGVAAVLALGLLR